MNTGSWNVEIAVNKMPQKVATAVSSLADTLIGAEYEPIAYLGSQVVNGINHAVLAKQIVTTGRDTENIVIFIFNEKNDNVVLVSIDRVVVGGATFGGVNVDVQTDIPTNIAEIFSEAFEGYLGAAITPYIFLGTQITKGVNYIFVATLSSVTLESTKKVMLITVNPMTKQVSMSDILCDRHTASLGYAFTW